MNTNSLLTSGFQVGAVEQAAEYGFTYWRALAARFQMSSEAANGVLGSLVYKRVFSAYALFDNIKGFRLSRFACGQLNLPPSLARSRGEQAPIFRLARLIDCERRQVRPLESSGLTSRFPELADFIDLADRFVPGVNLEIAALHVDHGGSADRAIARVNALAVGMKHPVANRLVWSGRLGIRLLTASRGKAEAITKRFAQPASDPLARGVEIDVVEDLQHLLAGRIAK